MANAIKKISVQRGYDVTRYALSTFGGAGGQHACAVADALGMTSVLIHPLAGALSAYGIGLADVIAMRETAVEAPLTEDLAARLPDEAFQPLEESARAELAAQGAATAVPGAIQVTRRAHLRYDGTDTPLQVPYGPAAEMTAAFEQAYRTRFSFLMADKPVVVEAVSVEAVVTSSSAAASLRPAARAPSASARPSLHGPGASAGRRLRRCACSPRGSGQTVPLYRRDALAPGQTARRPGDHRRGPGHDRGRARLAGRGDRRPRPAAHPGRRAPRRLRPGRVVGTGRRPGAARGVLQPVHGDRRADGGAPAVDRALRQHQGAPRLLLRDLRRRRRPDRERAAHPGPPRLDGRINKNGDKPQQGAD